MMTDEITEDTKIEYLGQYVLESDEEGEQL